MSDVWTVHCDGSAVPNPGRIGLGAVIVAPDGTRQTLSESPSLHGCNNEAELRALMASLLQLRQQGARALRVHSDNSVIVAQLSDPSARPIARLAALFDEARALIASFDSVQLQWIPQHRNGDADALARAALGMPPRAPARPRGRRR
ncbi:MAG: ribonuclease HI family protein [Pseudomonadota bacterium]